MRPVVQKYGGSSVADLERIRGVAARVAATCREGRPVVVVVSAMGNTTNELLALARAVTPCPDRRELDMLISVGERVSMVLLALALRDVGVSAVSLTGSQSGIITDERHADARVVEVRPDRLLRTLDAGHVAIVAGFQGVSRQREVTTLGRGGSDTTAVVLAAAIDAEHCEICSDVDGVWSADPRVVPEAVKLDALGLDEALALARGGAKVLFEDAVRYARDHGVEIRASATFGPGSGTRIITEAPARREVVAVTGDDQLVVVSAEEASALCGQGGRVRRRSGDAVWVDIRNLHGEVSVGRPTAVLTAAGSGVGERLDLGRAGDAALREAGVAVTSAGGEADALWWEIDRAAVGAATRAVHRLRELS